MDYTACEELSDCIQVAIRGVSTRNLCVFKSVVVLKDPTILIKKSSLSRETIIMKIRFINLIC
jgi:hypothetical protein